MMNIPFSPPDITEEEIREVTEALRSGWITTGPKTKEFEQGIAAFTHTEKAACLNSATACLELALHLLGIGPGDEVITSAYTYSASASVILHTGARPVLIDTAPGSYHMDYDRLEEAVTERTKAVIPVDIAGVMCDYERILAIAEQKRALFHPQSPLQKAFGRIAVVADAAHAFGASRHGTPCGQAADFTSFSFHAVKNLTTAEGGALVWKPLPEEARAAGMDDEWIYRQLMLLSLHGQSKDALSKTKPGAWEYDIVMPAYKCNMTDIMAAIGLAQLKRYPGMLARRRELLNQYEEMLSALPVQLLRHDGPDFSSSRHLCLVRLSGKTEDFRNRLIAEMAERGVAANVHYKPLPMHTAYKKLGFDIKDCPNAFHQYENEITLPLHTRLTDEEMGYIGEVFETCYRRICGR
ncbi:DegT/DnrJ/EryC1/StrS family aminotransferase [Otoolea muris]|uniref:DegT/DnrJ/EryC1/StrS family aminotransferase n=1 Tax=Otoolea muris TaxID=2941515 RepID=UPI00203C94A1|nr:DegT/DnrJ/EryC1/StrS aminotransferase family protein [Otoolea muris]